MKTDELDELFVDENEPIDKKIVVAIITPFVKSIGKNEVIEYSDKFETLTNWKKILVYLVCRKAMFLKEVIKEEAVGPKEIAEKTGMPFGTAKDISRDKNLKNLIIGQRSSYMIPNYKLKKVKELLIREEN